MTFGRANRDQACVNPRRCSFPQLFQERCCGPRSLSSRLPLSSGTKPGCGLTLARNSQKLFGLRVFMTEPSPAMNCEDPAEPVRAAVLAVAEAVCRNIIIGHGNVKGSQRETSSAAGT